MSATSGPIVNSLRHAPSWAIALALAALLALALIAANVVHASLAKRERVLDDGLGMLLYAAAFSGFADEWDLYDGQQSAAVVDGQLELRVRAPQTAAWSSARPRFRDFDMSVSLIALEGPIDNAMGVIFRARDNVAGACDLPAVVLCGVDQVVPLFGAALRQVFDSSESESRFAFMISSDGYYSLWKSEAGMARQLSAWIASPLINQGLGAANRIRVIARDSSYRFFINGSQVALCIPDDAGATSTYFGGECIDGAMQSIYRVDSNTAGKLGLIAQSTATGGAGLVVRFDNLLVFSPSATNDEDVKL